MTAQRGEPAKGHFERAEIAGHLADYLAPLMDVPVFAPGDAGAACPACGRAATRCVMTEGRTGSPCCGECLGHPRQRPTHVWLDKEEQP